MGQWRFDRFKGGNRGESVGRVLEKLFEDGKSRLLIRVLPLPAMIDTREGNPNIILFMNQAFQ